MDQSAEDQQNSSTADGGDLLGVCGDCCVDGSLTSADCSAASGCGGGDNCTHEVDDKRDDVCRNHRDAAADTVDTDLSHVSLDSVQPHPDVTTHLNTSPGNVAAAGKMSAEDGEKQIDAGNLEVAAEPVIDATDVYGGLRLVDGWNALTAERRREFGVGRLAAGQFTRQAGGSLALVRRLQLYSKLDGHSGCVNALHFNDAGNCPYSPRHRCHNHFFTFFIQVTFLTLFNFFHVFYFLQKNVVKCKV